MDFWIISLKIIDFYKFSKMNLLFIHKYYMIIFEKYQYKTPDNILLIWWRLSETRLRMCETKEVLWNLAKNFIYAYKLKFIILVSFPVFSNIYMIAWQQNNIFIFLLSVTIVRNVWIILTKAFEMKYTLT